MCVHVCVRMLTCMCVPVYIDTDTYISMCIRVSSIYIYICICTRTADWPPYLEDFAGAVHPTFAVGRHDGDSPVLICLGWEHRLCVCVLYVCMYAYMCMCSLSVYNV